MLALPVVLTITRIALVIGYLILSHRALVDSSYKRIGVKDPSNLIFGEQIVALVQLLYISIFLARKYRQMGHGTGSELLDRSRRNTNGLKQVLYATAFCYVSFLLPDFKSP